MPMVPLNQPNPPEPARLPKKRGRPPGSGKNKPKKAKKPGYVAVISPETGKFIKEARSVKIERNEDGLKGYFDAQLRTNKRDSANFPVDEQPGITESQLLWLNERLAAESDAEACEMAHYDSLIIKEWKKNPAFLSVYDMILGNKREGFKYLVTQALPKVLRTLLADLEDSNGRTRMAAATLILRTNGMLVDKVQRTDPDGVIRLMQLMSQTNPIQPMLIEPRE